MVKVSQVFVAGGMPSVTYVGRSHLQLEEQLRSHISQGYKITCLTGPTKSGKTVLFKRVLSGENFVTIEGGHVKSSDDFLIELRRALQLPTSQQLGSSNQTSGGINLPPQLGSFNIGKSNERSTLKNYQYDGFGHPISHMTAQGIALVIDDFHFIPAGVQREVVRSLKSEIFNGLKVILVAVPHRVFDAILAENEMQGRFARVQIPFWSESDLENISEIGFSVLGMNVPVECQKQFATESFGSPLLMQDFCRGLCGHYQVSATFRPERQFNPSDVIRDEIFSKVSQESGLPNFEIISTGPQSRRNRVARQLIDESGSLDLYQAVLKAAANTGPKERIAYNELRDKLGELLVGSDVPNKQQVSQALSHMARIAAERIKGDPIIEWRDDNLHITDPFLRFYMRWNQRDVPSRSN